MGVGFADELAFLDSLDQQESQAHGALDSKDALKGTGTDANEASCVAEKWEIASRGAAIAQAVDPTAELDLLDSLAKEAGIDIKEETKHDGDSRFEACLTVVTCVSVQ